jgi:very-short-patch-repair endonuclease
MSQSPCFAVRSGISFRRIEISSNWLVYFIGITVDSNSAPSKKTLIKYQNELLKKTTKSQLRATKIVKRIATDVFEYKIYPEKIFKPYILDIYIRALGVGIEIDGSVHNNQQTYDTKRDLFLWKEYQILVVRFDNDDINSGYFKQAIWDLCLQGAYAYFAKIEDRAKKRNIILPHDFPVIPKARENLSPLKEKLKTKIYLLDYLNNSYDSEITKIAK